MHRTLYNKTTGEIVGCANLSEEQLSKVLLEQPEVDYINIYTTGIKNIAVDIVTKKLKKVAPPPQNIAALIRQQRIGLLSSSDWTQSLDSPLSESKRAEWAAYRQALRDLPDTGANVNSIDDVVWPTQPQ
jgi:hypothetical protein